MSKSRLYDEIGAFTTVPNWAIDMGSQIGTDGLVLLMALRYHAGSSNEVFPAYELLRKHTGLTNRRLALAIRKLEELKIIERQKRFGQSTIYRIKNLLTPTDSTPAPRELNSSPPPGEQFSTPKSKVLHHIETNKNHLNRLKELDSQEEGDDVKIFSNQDVIPLLTRVSGLVAFPSREAGREEQILRFLEAYGTEKTEQALRAALESWKISKRKDGSGTYRITTMGWVDWAQDLLLNNTIEKPFEEMTAQEMMEWAKKQV